jgi:hypothetical protein
MQQNVCYRNTASHVKDAAVFCRSILLLQVLRGQALQRQRLLLLFFSFSYITKKWFYLVSAAGAARASAAAAAVVAGAG